MSNHQVQTADVSGSPLQPHNTSFSQSLSGPQPRNESTSQLANRPAKALKWSLKKKLCVSLLILGPVIGIAIAVAVILLKRTGSSNNGPPSSVSLTGLVLDSDQNPLVDVKLIGHAGATTRSIKNGYFAIQASILNGNIILDASFPGYAPNRGAMEYREGVRAYYMVLHLTRSTIMPLNNPSTSNQVSIDNLYGDTTNIIIPPLQGVSGPVYFEYAAIRPFAGPGDLKSEQPGSISGSPTLQSGGMYYFNLKDANNNPVPFPEQGITVQNGNAFNNPLPPSAAPDEPAWYKADLNQGRWLNSYTTAVGANAVAQAEGYWNWDRAYRTACAVGQIVSPSEQSCAGTHVKALGPDGIYSHSSTGPGGEFCIEGAATISSVLTVAGGGVSQTIWFSSTPGNCKDPINCSQLDPITASSENECPKPPPVYESCEEALPPMLDCARESYTTGLNACHNDLCGCEIYIEFVTQCWAPFEQLCCQNRTVDFDFRNEKYDCSTAQDALQGLQMLLCS